MVDPELAFAPDHLMGADLPHIDAAWTEIFLGIAISFAMIACNLFGGAVRDFSSRD